MLKLDAYKHNLYRGLSVLSIVGLYHIPPLFFLEVDATCSDFDFGTALHIAASNLCTSAIKCLLELGANPAFRVSIFPLSQYTPSDLSSELDKLQFSLASHHKVIILASIRRIILISAREPVVFS